MMRSSSGEVESLSMEKPIHFTSRAQKSNASGDHEIDNDNGSKSFPNPHHWIRNEILHLMVSLKEIVQVQNFARIGVEVRPLLFLTY